MLHLVVGEQELFDNATNKFYRTKGTHLQLEHSLVSMSKWESIWHKPLLSKKEKTVDEIISYVKCMTITQNVKPEVYNQLTNDDIRKINEYIDDSMTATKIYNNSRGKNNEQLTSELIYYWMIALNIPVKFEKWHLNRLLTLIQLCSIKNQPPKKMSKMELAKRNAELNAQRKAALNSKG